MGEFIRQIFDPACWARVFTDWHLFADAFLITLETAILALILALVLGVLFGLMSTSHNQLLRVIARIYVEFFQDTPLVLHAFILSFGLPYLGVMLGNVATGVLAVGIYTGAYISEVVRAGIESIPKGQVEAAHSQGFTYIQTMQYIVLPQTIKIVLPPLVNQMVNLIKNTSVLAMIGGGDLMNRINDWSTGSFGGGSYGAAYLLCGLLYFIVCFPLTTWARKYEARLKQRDIQLPDSPEGFEEVAS